MRWYGMKVGGWTLLLVALPLAVPARGGPARGGACPPTSSMVGERPDAGVGAKPTGTLLVANQFEGTATLIDLETGTAVHLPVGSGPHDATISPDGRWGVVSNYAPMGSDHQPQGRRLFVIDIPTGRIARTIDTGDRRGLHDVAFRPGHPTRVLVTAQSSRRVLEVDVATGEVIAAIDTRADRSHMLAVTPDGATVFTTNEGSGTISRLDLATGRFVASFPATPQVEGIAVTRDGDEVWVGESADSAVTVRDARTGRVLARHTGFRAPVRLSTTRDGRRVVISDPVCMTMTVADAATRRIVRSYRMPPYVPIAGDFTGDGRFVFVALGNDRAVIAVELETGRVAGRYAAGRGADGLGWAAKLVR